MISIAVSLFVCVTLNQALLISFVDAIARLWIRHVGLINLFLVFNIHFNFVFVRLRIAFVGQTIALIRP